MQIRRLRRYGGYGIEEHLPIDLEDDDYAPFEKCSKYFTREP